MADRPIHASTARAFTSGRSRYATLCCGLCALVCSVSVYFAGACLVCVGVCVRTVPTNVTHTRTHWHTCTLEYTHTHTHTHSYNLDFVDFENEWEDLPVEDANADGSTADPVGALDDEGYRRWTEAQLAIIRAALAEDEAEDDDEDEDDDEYAGGGGGERKVEGRLVSFRWPRFR